VDDSWTIESIGSGSSPLIIHVPHSATWIPDSERSNRVLDDTEFDGELARITDRFTDRMALDALTRAGSSAAVFINRASRLLIDPERFLGVDEPMLRVGMDPVYVETSLRGLLRRPDPVGPDHLIERYFRPYAAAFTDLVDQALATHGRADIIDLRSFPKDALPYELDPNADRPGICIGTDPFHTPPDIESAVLEAFTAAAWDVGTNSPFGGTYVPLAHLDRTPNVRSVMIEVRRDLYQMEPGGPVHSGYEMVVDHLAALIHRLAQPGT